MADVEARRVRKDARNTGVEERAVEGEWLRYSLESCRFSSRLTPRGRSTSNSEAVEACGQEYGSCGIVFGSLGFPHPVQQRSACVD